jgi:hypothetical protein
VSVDSPTQPLPAVCSCPMWCSPLYCDAVLGPVDVRHHAHPREWMVEEGDVKVSVAKVRVDERFLAHTYGAVLAVENVETLDMTGAPIRATVTLTRADRDRLVAELQALDLPA